MKPEMLNEITKFLKERIDESFFPEEKSALNKGLKLLNLSLAKYLQMQLKGFKEDAFESEALPEINMLALPQSPIIKVLNKMKLSKVEEKVMDDFSAVQLTLSVIIFEFFRMNLGKEDALEYAKYIVRNLSKIKTRAGEDTPVYIESFLQNMNIEIGFLEEDIKDAQSKNLITITQEELQRIQNSLHYLKVVADKQMSRSSLQKTVHKIHFDDYSGEQFERLMFAYVLRSKTWDSTPQWLGQAGSDSGRDIWAVFNKETYCYACANWKAELVLTGNAMQAWFAPITGGSEEALKQPTSVKGQKNVGETMEARAMKVKEILVKDFGIKDARIKTQPGVIGTTDQAREVKMEVK